MWRRIKDEDSQSPPATLNTSRVPELQDVRRSVMLNNGPMPPTNGASTTRTRRNLPKTTKASSNMNGVLKELMKQQQPVLAPIKVNDLPKAPKLSNKAKLKNKLRVSALD